MEIRDNIKICNYIIENGIKLLKQNKVNKLNVLVLNNLINIELDNNYYIITNMLGYKKFIDIISSYYKIILRYVPKIENNNICISMREVYMKYKQVNICILNSYNNCKEIV